MQKIIPDEEESNYWLQKERQSAEGTHLLEFQKAYPTGVLFAF